MKALLLAAGFGSRLLPLTSDWPKCLMPIHKRPLLEYWLYMLKQQGILDVIVNTHYHSAIVERFLKQPKYNHWVRVAYESTLLGTAGTIRNNIGVFKKDTVMVAHADNWSCFDMSDFIDYHNNHRPKDTVMTMMIFDCPTPKMCGVVELDDEKKVIRLHEKVSNPPGNLANAAVYLIESEVLEFINDNPDIVDFSTDVLPHFMCRIATWKNNYIHKDIGTIKMLKKAQLDPCVSLQSKCDNLWQKKFLLNPIHRLIKNE